MEKHFAFCRTLMSLRELTLNEVSSRLYFLSESPCFSVARVQEIPNPFHIKMSLIYHQLINYPFQLKMIISSHTPILVKSSYSHCFLLERGGIISKSVHGS